MHLPASTELATVPLATAPTATLSPAPVSPGAGDQGHSCTPSDPNVLSAPSPILPPTSSVHFKTTTDLRGRHPGDGLSSLQSVQQRARKNLPPVPVTEAEHACHPVPPSSATSFAAAASSSSSPPTKKNPVDRGDRNDALPGDDPTPFAFKPLALAALVDPKTLRDLEKMGGLQGLCTGLGTSPTKGLSAHSLGQGASADGERSGGEGPFAAPFSDRQRIYGINTLPTRRSKSLLQLMWLALKDKVLVCSIAIAIATTFT